MAEGGGEVKAKHSVLRAAGMTSTAEDVQKACGGEHGLETQRMEVVGERREHNWKCSWERREMRQLLLLKGEQWRRFWWGGIHSYT